MIIDILTLFPKMFKGPFAESIIKRASDKGLVSINIHNLRDWAIDQYGTVDDRPYGGGKGMVLRPEPIDVALRHLKLKIKSFDFSQDKNAKLKMTKKNSKIILLSPTGKVFNQKMAQKIAKLKWLVLICGHYEGVDQRVADYLVDEEVSIGDYILTGGEIAAMVITDAVVRLLPGVLDKEALKHESFNLVKDKESGKKVRLLEAPQYTRPKVFQGHKVPEILLSGDHKEIAQWREKKAWEITETKRKDLSAFAKKPLS